MRQHLHTFVLVFVMGSIASAVDEEALLRTFEIHPDFQLELAAAEPLVFDPVDLEFDHHGHAYVLEMPGYPSSAEEGRIVLLVDDDHDGIFEERRVFAEELGVADSLLPYNDGFLVAAPPDILFLRDTDGDGRADVRETILTGFPRANTQHNISGLTYGFDNWIYASNGGNSGAMIWPERRSERVPLRGGDFRFSITEQVAERIGRSSGGFEFAMNDWGHIFGTHNLRHINFLVLRDDYTDGLPIDRSEGLEVVSDHEENGLARIYPLGPQEMRVNHPEQAGYFSGSCGITHYGGGAFGEAFDGNILVADVVLNLIHRDQMSLEGTTYRASRVRKRSDFLASSDRAFRPVNMTVSPDGSLYVLDMHRDVIEHPEWIPDEMEAELDIDAGRDQGRIYRITPQGGLASAVPTFSRETWESAVAALGHRNKWWRDTAQRLLVEWQPEGAIEKLESFLSRADDPRARMHALWTLEGLNGLTPEMLEGSLRDPHPRVREHGVLLADQRIQDQPSIQALLLPLLSDLDQRVRFQALITLGRLPADERSSELSKAAVVAGLSDTSDKWSRLALLSYARAQPLAVFEHVMNATPPMDDHRRELVSSLAGLVAEHDGQAGTVNILESLVSDDDPLDASVLISVLDGLSQSVRVATLTAEDLSGVRGALEALSSEAGVDVLDSAWRLQRSLGISLSASQLEVIAEARIHVRDTMLSKEVRLRNLSLLASDTMDNRRDILFELLKTSEPKEIQIASMSQLAEARDPLIAEGLIERWRTLGRETRVMASDVLLYQRQNHPLLLSALEDGKVRVGEFNFHLERRRTLLRSRAAGIASRAQKIFSDAGVVTRKAALEAMKPALKLQGDVERGKEIYTERCAQCHSIGALGRDVGPNLTDIFRKSGESLLHDILDPNAAVDANYTAYTAERNTGEVINGILIRETDAAITLLDGQSVETTLQRSELVDFYSDGLSLMPEELEADLDPERMADLLAFLQEPR